jgi:hypothetical protein
MRKKWRCWQLTAEAYKTIMPYTKYETLVGNTTNWNICAEKLQNASRAQTKNLHVNGAFKISLHGQ